MTTSGNGGSSGSTSSSSDPTSSAKAPDTGYGTPSKSSPVITGLSVVAVIAIAGGVALLYNQKRTKAHK